MNAKTLRDRIPLRLQIKLTEKRYKSLKYIYQKAPASKSLIVVFSGFSPKNTPASYNYIRTLQNLNVNKLFILDHFGFQKRGSYYLGENGDWFIPSQVKELIDRMRASSQASTVITVGSSKGGTAALFFANLCCADHCVIGAPQYRLGDYLNTDAHRDILVGIMGNAHKDSVDALNQVIPSSIRQCPEPKPKVHLHYSPAEHTYSEHIAGLLDDLRANGFSVFEDNEWAYTVHSDVAKVFPQFLLNVLNHIVGP